MTDTLITITYEDYRLAKSRFYCNVEHIHGVGVNEERYYPVSYKDQMCIRGELGYTLDQKIILCVGELLTNKNQKMAIQMMTTVIKKYPDAKLLLAGNGPEKENLEKEIIKYGLQSNVEMLGYCTFLEKYQRITDVLVACSYREGLPLNLVEAMLTGNPVVGSINRGHKELIINGKTGYLVGDASEMADKVLALLDNELLHESLAVEAMKHAKNYGFHNVKKELARIYKMENVNCE
jgi:glycosyltransferase EpsD